MLWSKQAAGEGWPDEREKRKRERENTKERESKREREIELHNGLRMNPKFPKIVH